MVIYSGHHVSRHVVMYQTALITHRTSKHACQQIAHKYSLQKVQRRVQHNEIFVCFFTFSDPHWLSFGPQLLNEYLPKMVDSGLETFTLHTSKCE